MSADAPAKRPARWFVGGVAAAAAVVSFGVASAPAHASVWLCKPGMKNDPCAPGLSTTICNPALTKALGVEHPRAESNPPIDCFYVYPTVSDEKTPNADLTVQDTERSIALYQASRYSQYCRVPSLEAPRSRSRNTYGTSTRFLYCALAITSSRIL